MSVLIDCLAGVMETGYWVILMCLRSTFFLILVFIACLFGMCDGDRVLGILASLAKEEEDHPRHNLQLGQIVSAQSVL